MSKRSHGLIDRDLEEEERDEEVWEETLAEEPAPAPSTQKERQVSDTRVGRYAQKMLVGLLHHADQSVPTKNCVSSSIEACETLWTLTQ